MATYYVRPDGNDGNTGLGSSTAQAWATIAKALGATGITGGDTVYIAPGRYATQVIIGGTYSSATFVTGDPLCTQFSGLTAGRVSITNINSSGTSVFTGVLVNGSAKSNLAFSNIAFENNVNTTAGRCVDLLLGQNNSFTKCTFRQTGYGAPLITMTAPASSALNATIDRCVMGGGQVTYSGTAMLGFIGNNVSDTTSVKNCLFYAGVTGAFIRLESVGVSVYNCTFLNHQGTVIQSASGSLTYPTYVRNCLFVGCSNSMNSSVTGHIVQEYNRLMNSSLFQVATSVTSTTNGDAGIEDGYSLIVGLDTTAIHATQTGSFNTSFGTASGAPVTDIYGFAWSGTSPDAGMSTYKTLATVNPTYNPTDRNASTITIAPGSTSQSIELYLGATGLTASTSGLSAYYNRTRTASVNIPLVARTIAQSWTSGGFAEVDSVTMPGVYRLDLPNEAVAIGVDDVTVNVRGAAGTNGAVITVNLKATESSLISMGPYKVIADGLGADQPLDIMQGVQAPVSVQVVDVNENGIDITGATVQAKAYNSAGTLVGTYTCTPTYAADGRCTFLLTTAVTNVAGVYSVTITRAVGGNVVVFGPLKVMVRAN